MEAVTKLEVLSASSERIREHLDEFVELLRDSVDGGSSVNFLPPMDEGINRRFWERVCGEVERGERVVVCGLVDGRVVGCAHLALAGQPNGAHRAEVQKVLVLTAMRRRGIARALMAAIEDEARRLGRWLLVLDTELGSGAEQMYPRLGYVRVGEIPVFARAANGEFISTVLFYKRLDHPDAR